MIRGNIMGIYFQDSAEWERRPMQVIGGGNSVVLE